MNMLQVIREKAKIDESTALFLFVNGSILVKISKINMFIDSNDKVTYLENYIKDIKVQMIFCI